MVYRLTGGKKKVEKDEVRARRIAYDIRVNNMTQEQVVLVLIRLMEDVRSETHDQYEM